MIKSYQVEYALPNKNRFEMIYLVKNLHYPKCIYLWNNLLNGSINAAMKTGLAKSRSHDEESN
jgi:hypothetical protein